MAKRYDPTEYLYVSARIRALEGRLLSTEQWNRLVELSDQDEILAAFTDGRAETARGEACAEAALRAAISTVAESVPDKRLPLFLQYPYDCNNVKALEKCRRCGADPAELLIDLGSIPVKDLKAALENELLERLPPHMSTALLQAREAFEKTADPREIDFILDKAAFADMAEAAAPFPFAAELVTVKAELIDLLMCCRLIRMRSPDLGRAMLDRAALSQGRFEKQTLLDWYDAGEQALLDGIFGTPYAKIFDKEASLFQIEKRADDYLMSLVRRARSVIFGAEVPIAYLMALETEGKNLRILLAGKRAGLDSTAIKARMREHYV